MHKLLTTAALLGTLGATALADPATGLFEWQVSANGGATWSSSITVNPGDSYLVRGRAGWTTLAGTTDVGFAGSFFEQIDLIGADSSDVFGGASGPGGVPTYLERRMGGVPVTWTLQAGTGASALGMKIDNVNPVNRTELGQLAKYLHDFGLNPDFRDANPDVQLLLEAAAGSPKTLTISSTWYRCCTPRANFFRIYTNETGTNKAPVQEATLTDARVWIRPNASCVPDFNGDGLVDFADYLDFLSFYDTQDFRADLTRDGLVDFSDYLEFLSAYDAGC